FWAQSHGLDYVYISSCCNRNPFYGECYLAVFQLQFGQLHKSSNRDCDWFGFGLDPTLFCWGNGQKERQTGNAETLQFYDGYNLKIQLLIVAKSAQLPLIASPIFVHLHLKFEMDLFSEEFFQIFSRFGSHSF